jgi:UDP:flavonoid glycosyltransferase YjiC (YdhE family)
MPPSFSFAPSWLPAAFAFRQDDEVDRGGALPDWVAALPAGRPLVLGSLGTALPMMQDAGRSAPGGPPADPAAGLRALVRGANEVDAEVVVATGGLDCDVEPAPHVHLERWVPQPLLLQVADAMVTHGGYNTVREAVRHGVPMVAFPQFGDQFASAGRIAALGLGRHVDGDSHAPGLSGVLADGAVHGTVRAAQRAMLTLPPVASFVDLAESLVRA